MSTTLARLSAWYLAQCDGDWEHGEGLTIETLDNPGWRLQINLVGTSLEALAFEVYEHSYEDERHWLRCWRDATQFHAACGPTRLEDALLVFLSWAKA
jgi:Immunity protein 53